MENIQTTNTTGVSIQTDANLSCIEIHGLEQVIKVAKEIYRTMYEDLVNGTSFVQNNSRMMENECIDDMYGVTDVREVFVIPHIFLGKDAIGHWDEREMGIEKRIRDVATGIVPSISKNLLEHLQRKQTTNYPKIECLYEVWRYNFTMGVVIGVRAPI